MAYKSDLLIKIDALKRELDTKRPLQPADQKRLDTKLRLEWNYNSNHIEGNTLTYGQTELLLIFDKTSGDHDMREYEEMKAHDVATQKVAEFATDKNRALTEADIREINRIILVRPYWANAITADGQPTRKLIQPGEYKKQPNHVRLANGEIFHYASPEETPAKMQELIDWYRSSFADPAMHPVVRAALLHYRLVRIHPFDDSNGRTSRLLMNYELLRHGFPPVIVRSEDKKGYLNALNKADVGDMDAFVDYIAQNLIWSLDISLRAARGEDVSERGDVYKEIEVWKRDSSTFADNQPKDIHFMNQFLTGFYLPLFELLDRKQKPFDDLFLERTMTAHESNNGTIVIRSKNDVFEFYSRTLEGYKIHASLPKTFKWGLHFFWDSLKMSPRVSKSLISDLVIDFAPFTYTIRNDNNGERLLERPYPAMPTVADIDEIVERCVRINFEAIRSL